MGFIYCWRISLVVLSITPVIAIGGLQSGYNEARAHHFRRAADEADDWLLAKQGVRGLTVEVIGVC